MSVLSVERLCSRAGIRKIVSVINDEKLDEVVSEAVTKVRSYSFIYGIRDRIMIYIISTQ